MDVGKIMRFVQLAQDVFSRHEIIHIHELDQLRLVGRRLMGFHAQSLFQSSCYYYKFDKTMGKACLGGIFHRTIG